MASGKAHAETTSAAIVIAVTMIATVEAVAQVPEIQAFVSGHLVGLCVFVTGLIVGHAATPDVRDQQRKRNEGEHIIDRLFGRMWGRLWTAIWEPMAKRIPHRHWASHLAGPATLIAAVWLWWLPALALWLYSPQWFALAWSLKWWHVAGWFVQDCVHLLQDGGLSGIRWGKR